MSTKQTVHPHLNLYKWRQDWLIYLILLLCFDHFQLFLFVLSGWKKMKQKRTLNMQVKVILRKTQQGNSLSKELKDKYETRIHNSLQLDCWIAVIVVSIVFPACHVFKINHIELNRFVVVEMGKKRKKEGKFDGDQKVKHQTVSERKRYVIFSLHSTRKCLGELFCVLY